MIPRPSLKRLLSNSHKRRTYHAFPRSPSSSLYRSSSLRKISSPLSTHFYNNNGGLFTSSFSTANDSVNPENIKGQVAGSKVDVSKYLTGSQPDTNNNRNPSEDPVTSDSAQQPQQQHSTSDKDSNRNVTSLNEVDANRPKLKKNEQQIAEEELYMLQSHVKQHFQHANFTEALSTSKEILEKSTALFGKKHPATASAYNNIGLMHKMMGDFDLSRENYHSALSIYKDIVGKDHASYAATLNNLGNLDRSQSTVDENLTSLQRMQLNDTAVEYFEEAWNIRKAELGEEHVYTVTSRSNLGGALAAQVLQSEFLRQKRLREEEDKNEKNMQQKDTKNFAWTVSKYTKQKWEIAEEHLRAAFRTAVTSPRGERIDAQSQSLPSSSTVKRRDKTLSKKEKQKAAKLRRREEKTKSLTKSNSWNHDLGPGDTSICTLSAAAAAQNLAVFLKSRADLISNARDADPNLDCDDMYAEAKRLYVGALRVRTQVKGENHPDTVATKFSLAELLDAIGDENGANTLREELLDSYNVEEMEIDDANTSSDKH